MQVVSLLNEKGRAICITTGGELFNRVSKPIREQFLQRGYIESVISLPSNVLNGTALPPKIIVFSFGNKKVRMVDASIYFKKGRRVNVLSEDDIENIFKAYRNNVKDISCNVDIKEIQNFDYSLEPEHYTKESINVKDGISLGELVSDISRGSSLSRMQLEKLHSNSKTKCRYLMLKDINNGQLSDSLPYIKQIPDNNLRYCVNNGDIVLSKIGPNFKVAVIEKEDDEKILTTGNLYILRFVNSKMPVEYIKLFLDSKEGQLQLQRYSTGTVMRGISLEALKKIQIPKLSDKQISSSIKKYKDLKTEIALHKRAIKKAEEQIKDLF